MASKILVTGGTGYIGSHTVVELQEAGYEVIIVDDLSNSDMKILGQITMITGKKPEFFNLDLSNEAKVLDFVQSRPDISGVIHFAAYKAVGESVHFPLKYYRNNLFSLINLLNVFSERDVQFIFSSSCTVYGQPDVLPVTENTPFKKAESPYGNTKQIAEEILQETAMANDNYHITSLRYFNPVGAHQSALIGELPIGVPQNLVPFITQSAIGKRGPITVYGDDYNTPDGSCIRDYIHVVDLAKAHVAAIKNSGKDMGNNYSVYNIGTGKGSSVLEVIHAFEGSTGVKLNYKIGPRRPGDIEQVWGDVSKSANQLKWKTELSLEDMMSSAWAWEQYINKNPF